MDKSVIRAEILRQRNLIPEEDRILFSKQIAEQVMKLPEYREADVILGYCSYKSEVMTTLLNEAEAGKRLYLPRIDDAENKCMDFLKVENLSDLVDGYMHIAEPVEGDVFYPSENVGKKIVMIMPGSGFDPSGNRLGYGGGFYDRYLSKCNRAHCKITKIGLAFSCQIIPRIPADPWDAKVDKIITQDGEIHE